MTPEEKEIREAERKAMAEVRRWKIKESRILRNSTFEEWQAYLKKSEEEWEKQEQKWHEEELAAAK